MKKALGILIIAALLALLIAVVVAASSHVDRGSPGPTAPPTWENERAK
jgi:hypothetical protein